MLRTWPFAPPMPNELTLILADLSRGQGIGSTGTCRLNSSKGTVVLKLAANYVIRQ